MEGINPGPDRQLDYSPEFKQFVAENKGVLSSVFHELEKFFQEDTETSDGAEITTPKLAEMGVKVFVYGNANKEPREINSNTYRVEINNSSFFVKKAKLPLWWGGDGFAEYQSTLEIEELCKTMPGVRVAKGSMGYYEKSSNTSYYVSRWEDSLQLNLGRYIKNLERKLHQTKSEGEQSKLVKDINILVDRVQEIKNTFNENFFDVRMENMAYDEETDEIVLFDITKNGNETKRKEVVWD